MDNSTNKMKIVMLVGSLRRQSLNRQLAEEAGKLLEDEAECTIFTPAGIPLFDQDTEFPVPEQIETIRQAIRQSDGVWIFSPEYNGAIPGGLKNLLDWLSRPLFENDPDWKDTAVWGKKATISGIGGNNATRSVQDALITLLHFMGMDVMTEDRAMIAMSPETMKTSNLSKTENVQDALKTQADAFMKFIEK